MFFLDKVKDFKPEKYQNNNQKIIDIIENFIENV